jgi:hypothetical protein
MLTNIRCLDGAGQPVGWADLSTRTVTLPLQAADVTCTFSNQQAGSIRIPKQTDPPVL